MKKILKPQNKNLKFLIFQNEKQGAEMKPFQGDRPGRVGATKINPIERLYSEKKLTREERRAAKNYQYQFELSNISHHARPSYDGTTISTASSQLKEGGPTQAQIDAERYVFAVKAKIALKNYETDKNFKIIDLKFIKILENIFEKQIAVRNCEAALKADHRTIEKRIKTICKIILDYSPPQS